MEIKKEVNDKILPVIREMAGFQTWVEEQLDARDTTIADLKAALGECGEFIKAVKLQFQSIEIEGGGTEWDDNLLARIDELTKEGR